MPTLTAVLGDITTLKVDAIVNAASTQMRGGGGVDGAIHRAGGPAILKDCVRRFPRGLATGDAGWTTAGAMPARWVIHTVGPNYAAGQTDRSLLVSCYRRSLEVADELGARSVAFPLISAGIYGWPREDAIAAAVQTIASTPSQVESASIVAFSEDAFDAVRRELARETPLRILQGVRALHDRGYEGVRALPGMAASGMYWRVAVAAADAFAAGPGGGFPQPDADAIRYTTGGLTSFAGGEVTVTTTADEVADLILAALPHLPPAADPAYAAWFAGLLQLAEARHALPIAYADYFDDALGWEIGWGSGARYPHPPA